MNLHAVVSYRSIPKILDLLPDYADIHFGWTPHFTSVINWTLRFGLGLLKQVEPISEPWFAIMDHSIDIGTKKVFVILRVTLDALLDREGAIQLKDCECIGLKVSETVNGESISEDLEEIFSRAGNPTAIIKDCDYTLQKGVRLYTSKKTLSIPVIEDIGHVMANALKAQYEDSEDYKKFTSLINKGKKRLHQTSLAFLAPPKLRSKGRFQSISNLGKWAEKMLNVLSVKGRAKKGSILAKLRKALPGFMRLKPFVNDFANSTMSVSSALKILKNKGYDKKSREQCHIIINRLPKDSKVRIRMKEWLKHHNAIQKEIGGATMLVSSDIIESLFGSFKYANQRNPQSDMNRSVLLIPTLCGIRSESSITRALNIVKHKDLKKWEIENIPYTQRKMRKKFFSDHEAIN